MGGNNSHVVLEQFDMKIEERTEKKDFELLVFSAKSEGSLKAMLNEMSLCLDEKRFPLVDMAFTLQVGRRELPMRKYFVVDRKEPKLEVSDAVVYGDALRDPKIVFMFPGMGSQYPTMTLDMYQQDEIYRKHVDICVETARNVLGVDLGFFFDAKQVEKSKVFCYKNNYAQMYLFIVEYALAQTLIHYGINPDYIMGHSFGEYVGGVVAGVFDLKDGMKVVYDTAVVMEKLEKGLMLSVSTTEMDAVLVQMEEINKEAGDVQLQLSVVNSPKNFVISGRIKAVKKLKSGLEEKGITCRLLHTPNAYHCFLMDPVVSDSCEIVKKFRIRRHNIPFMSAVTASLVEKKFSSEYWGRHLREKVLFSQTVQNLMEKHEEMVFLEVGPHIVLNKLVREQKLSKSQRVLSMGKHPKLKDNEFKVFLNSVGELWSCGLSVDWKKYHGNNKRYRVPLPGYPFNHENEITFEKKFVPQKRMFKELEILGVQRKSSMKGGKVNFCAVETCQNLINYTTLPWLESHVFQGVVIVPGASWVSLYLEFSPCVENIHFFQVLKVSETEHAIVQTIKEEETGRLKVMSKPFDQPDAEWTFRSDGVPIAMPKRKPEVPQHVKDFMGTLDTCKYYDHKTFYARFYEIDFHFGECFKCIQDVYVGDEETFCKILMRRPELPYENFSVQPVIMDNILQCVFGTTLYISETFLPNNIEKIMLYDGDFPKILNCHCKVTEMNEDFITADYVVFDDDMKVYMEIFSFRGINLKRQIERDPNASLLEVHWQRKDIPAIEKLPQLFFEKSEDGFEIEEQILKAIEGVSPGEKVQEILSQGEEGEITLLEKFYCESKTISSTLEYVASIIRQIVETFAQEDVQRVVKILDLDDSGFIARTVVPLLKDRDGFVEYRLRSGNLMDKAKADIKDFNFVSIKKIALDAVLEDDVNSIDILLGFNLESVSNFADALVDFGKVILVQPKRKSTWESIFGEPNEVKELGDKFNNFEVVDKLPLSVVFGERNTLRDGEEKSVKKFERFFDKDPLKLQALVTKLDAEEEVNLLVFFVDVLNSPEYAEVYGMAKVLKNEYPNWDVKLVNLLDNGIIIDEIVEKISKNPTLFENEISVDSSGQIFVPRIVEAIKEEDKDGEEEMKYYKVEKKPGGLKNVISFQYSEFTPPELTRDYILVKVHAAPVNFRDVLILMTLLIDETTQNVGYEFSGEVVKVGPDCKKVKVGDNVFGFGTCTYGSYCLTEESIIATKPDFLSFQQAASIPMAFCTAYFCLFDLGKIEKGDKVLIHSAAGSVGQAAIQFCNNLGAEVYATVGSQRKRDYLREKYGVTKFADSHSDDWELDIEEQCPEGFDIIINSLRGEGIKKGVLLLKERGRFCEIGWRDIVDNMKMGLRRFMRNISFTAFNLKRIGEDKYKKHQIRDSLEAMLPMFEKGEIKTTIDKEFEIDDLKSAYKYLLKNDYLGKIVVNVVDDQKNSIIPKTDVVRIEKLFSPEKTYVVSGGLGGLGVELFKFMAAHGAQNILLLSRSGKITKRIKRDFASVKKEYNCNVKVSKTDVGDIESVKRMFSSIQETVGGIFHLAVVYNDQALRMIDQKNYEYSVKAKKFGALNLIELCPEKGEKLEFFLSFSTLATVVGNPGQGAYSAANIYCEIMARKLRKKNVNAYALCVPNIINVGVIARDHVIRRKMRIAGLLQTGMTSDELFVYVELLLKRPRLKGEQSTFLTQYDFGNFIEDSNLKIGQQVSHLCGSGEEGGLKEKKLVTYESINAVVKDVISSEQDIDPTKYLMEYGVDSLAAVELSAILKAEFGVVISQMDLVSGLTINKILEIAKKQEEE